MGNFFDFVLGCYIIVYVLFYKMVEITPSTSLDLKDIEGIKVYDQETFEDGVSKQLDVYVEKQKKEHDLKRFQKELQSVKANLAKTVLNLKKAEEVLRVTVSRGITSDRKLQILLNQQEQLKTEVDKLKESKTELETSIQELEASKETQIKHEENDEDAPTNETEQEKSIRLGQMTAFGKMLVTKTEKDEENNIANRNYMKDWMQDGSDSDSDKGKAMSQKHINEIMERGKRKKKEKVERYDKGYNTDDEDWDYSDEEDESSNDSGVVIKKKKAYSTVDDGDKDIYLQRLQEWQDSRTEKSNELDSKYEELDGGMRVPARLWSSLYHYQKVAVQWLWELHQQDVGGILGDEMGLGKTVQMVTFLASLSYSSKKQRHCKLGPVLIVCPTTVMH